MDSRHVCHHKSIQQDNCIIQLQWKDYIGLNLSKSNFEGFKLAANQVRNSILSGNTLLKFLRY